MLNVVYFVLVVVAVWKLFDLVGEMSMKMLERHSRRCKYCNTKVSQDRKYLVCDVCRRGVNVGPSGKPVIEDFEDYTLWDND